MVFVALFPHTSEKYIFSGRGVMVNNRPVYVLNHYTLSSRYLYQRILNILSVVHQLAFSWKFTAYRCYSIHYCLLKSGAPNCIVRDRNMSSELQNCWGTPALAEFSTNDSGALLKVQGCFRCTTKGFKSLPCPPFFCDVFEILRQIVTLNCCTKLCYI